MNRKLLVTLSIFTLMTLVGYTTYLGIPGPKPEIIFSQEIDDGENPVTIDCIAPETCAIGEMITIDVSNSNANAFEWLVIPETPNFRVVNNGREALFCAGSPGIYVFVIAASQNDRITMVRTTVIVEASVAPEPESVDDDFTIKVKSWLPSNPDPLVLEKLARSFEIVAAAGHADVAGLVKVTALSNRAILSIHSKYKSFLIELSKHLKENYNEATIEAHIELWFSLANTLRSIK